MTLAVANAVRQARARARADLRARSFHDGALRLASFLEADELDGLSGETVGSVLRCLRGVGQVRSLSLLAPIGLDPSVELRFLSPDARIALATVLRVAAW